MSITAEHVHTLFGDLLDRIESDDLRGRTVACWVDACARGGWTRLEQLQDMPFSLLTDCRGVSFPEHTAAVTAGALGLAEGQARYYRSLPYAIDLDYLIAGGLLHDVGKLLEIEPDGDGGYRKSHSGRCTRHPISGVILAAQHGLPLGIQNMIANHAKEGEGRPQRVETVLVHQADYATFNPLVMLTKDTLITQQDD